LTRNSCSREPGILHYKKDGQHADVSGEYIELNLATGAVTVKQTSSAAKPASVGEAILYGGDAL
jgi:hypothetical protein